MRNNIKRFVCLLLVMALTFVLPSPAVSQAAKKKTPKLNKSKLTLTVGKTAKLKVKNTKKKIKWSSSKKSVATVTKKGKVKAKKAGKTTITAKVGKKKLKCKVTVTAKKSNTKATPKPATNTTVKPVANRVAKVRVLNYQLVEVVFHAAQNLTEKNFTLRVKEYKNGTFNRKLKIDKVKTTNQKNYFLELDEDYVKMGEYVQVTATGLTITGTSTQETLYIETINPISESIYTGTEGVSLSTSIDLDGFGYKSITSVDLPKGLEYAHEIEYDGYDTISISGTPAKAGVYNKKIVYKDELGTTYTKNVQWIIGSEKTLAAGCEVSYGAVYTDAGVTLNSSFYVAGGSGDYLYNVLDSDAKVNTSDGYVFKKFDREGDYALKIQVVDAKNAELKTTFLWQVHIKQARKICVEILDGTGKVIKDVERMVSFQNQDTSTPYEQDYQAYNTHTRELAIWVVDGVYDIQVDMDGYRGLQSSYVVNGKDAELKIKLPIYRVDITSANPNYSISETIWYDDSDEKSASGSIMYFPTGTYTLHGSSVDGIYRIAMNTTVTVKAVANNKATAIVKKVNDILGSLTIANPGTVTLNNSYYQYYKFVPEESGTYQFYSASKSEYTDTRGQLYDDKNQNLSSNDDGKGNGQFLITYECIAGETYYIGVNGYSEKYNGKEVFLHVEKVVEE